MNFKNYFVKNVRQEMRQFEVKFNNKPLSLMEALYYLCAFIKLHSVMNLHNRDISTVQDENKEMSK